MTPNEYQKFGQYAKNKGISSLNLHYHNQKIEDSLTPYVLEERQMNVTQIDVFSRLMLERIIWVAGGVDGVAVVRWVSRDVGCGMVGGRV